jgi:hypothetical protein
MSNWKPGNGFMQMVQQTKRNDETRRLARSARDTQDDQEDLSDLSMDLCPACGKFGPWHSPEDCPVAGPLIEKDIRDEKAFIAADPDTRQCMLDNGCTHCDYRGPEHGGPHCHTLS